MKLCIDHADIREIRRLYGLYPLDGVSTNPTILARCGRAPYEALREIRELIGPEGELFVQAVSRDAEGMVREAGRITKELGSSTLVKVPCVPEGYRAMKMLKKEGFRFIGTAVYSAMQGFLAVQCGAEYVAPYINRIDSLGFDGVQVARDLHDAIRAGGYDSGLLAASFRNTRQVLELVRYGVKAVTLAPEIFDAMAGIPAAGLAVRQFTEDFEALTWPGCTMENC